MESKRLVWLVLGGLAGLVLLTDSGSSTLGQDNDATRLTSWEYEVESLSGSKHAIEAELDELGSEGWELVTMSPNPRRFKETDVLFVFKRPVR